MINKNSESRASETDRKDQLQKNEEIQGSDSSEDHSSVNEGQIKERQPSRAEDLSSIHDTHEVGTSGGDQRSKDNKPSVDDKQEAPVITNLGKEEVEPSPLEHSKANPTK